MKAPHSDFTDQAEAFKSTPINLVEIELSSASTIRYAFWDTDISFDSETYTALRGEFSPPGTNIQLELPNLSMEFDNVDKYWVDVVADYDLQGNDVTIKTVFEDELDNADAFIADTYTIGSWVVLHNKLSIELSTKFNVVGVVLPRRTYQAYFCSWKFRDQKTCGYSVAIGNLSKCDKSFDGDNGCTKHFLGTDIRRFGGFPSRIRRTAVDGG